MRQYLRAKIHKPLHVYLFYLLLLFLPTQLGRHFWFDFSFVRGIRIDYLSPTLYLTDILILFTIGFWGLESILKRMENGKWKIDGKNRMSLRGARLRATWQSFFNTYKKSKQIDRHSRPGRARDDNKLIFVSLIMMFIIGNILFSISPWLTVYKWIKVLEFGLLALYISRNYWKLDYSFIGLFAITLVYSFIIAVGQFLHGGSLGGLLWWLGERTFTTSTPGIALATLWGQQFLRPYATFPHPNVLSGYSLIVTTILIANFSTIKQQWTRLVVSVGILCGIGLIVLSFSRSVWIVSGVTLVLLAILYASNSLRKFILNNNNWSLKFFVSFFFLVCFMFLVFQNTLRFDETIQTRQLLNTLAGSSFLNHPILGTGLGTFIPTIPQLIPISSNSILQPVHNIVLLFLAEGGVVGLLVGSVAAVALVKKAIQSHWMYMLVVVQLLSLALVDHYFFTIQQTQLLLAIIVGLIAQQNKPITQSANNPINKIKKVKK